MPITYATPRSSGLSYPTSTGRGRFWGAGSVNPPGPTPGTLIDGYTWLGGHDFTRIDGSGNVPGHNGTEVSLANQGGRPYTTGVSTGEFTASAIGSARLGKAVQSDGGTYQFVGAADPIFDSPGDTDIHWRILAVDDPDTGGGFATWFQRRIGLDIERAGSSNSTGGQLQFTLFQGTGSPVSVTSGVPTPSLNGKAILIDLRQVAATGDVQMSVNGNHFLQAGALTTPLRSFSGATISALNATVGACIWFGVRHAPFSDAQHDADFAGSGITP